MNNDIYIKPMTPTRRAEIDEALKMRSMNFENVNKTVLCKRFPFKIKNMEQRELVQLVFWN